MGYTNYEATTFFILRLGYIIFESMRIQYIPEGSIAMNAFLWLYLISNFLMVCSIL